MKNLALLFLLSVLVAADPEPRAVCLVLIKTEDALIPQSGFFVTSEGGLLTAAHAWPDDPYGFDSDPWVWTRDGGKYRAEVTALDWGRDIALLHVTEELTAPEVDEEEEEDREAPILWSPVGDRRFPCLRLAYADQAEAGEPVTVAGYAHIGERELLGWPGPDLTVQRGPILGRRMDEERDHLQVLDLGLRLAEGLSGAPVLDGRGRVLGLVFQWTPATDPDTGEEVGYSAQAVSSKTLAWWLRKELGPGW